MRCKLTCLLLSDPKHLRISSRKKVTDGMRLALQQAGDARGQEGAATKKREWMVQHVRPKSVCPSLLLLLKP